MLRGRALLTRKASDVSLRHARGARERNPAPCGHLTFAAGDPIADRIGLGAAELRYAALGLPVFSVQAGGKKPLLGSHGFLDATRDPALITARRAVAGRTANPAGRTGGSWLVIDCDRKWDADGPAEFARWLAGIGVALPAVPYVRTPNDGVHLFLRKPPDRAVASRAGVLPGVDLRGEGGYVVLPPGRLAVVPIDRPGERGGGTIYVPYDWRGCPCQAPEAPAALLDALEHLHGSVPASGNGVLPAGGAGDLAALTRTGIPRGRRNSTLYRLACSRYRARGTHTAGAAEVLDELRAVWQGSDHAGFSWREVLTIAESARRFIGSCERREQRLLGNWLARTARTGGRP